MESPNLISALAYAACGWHVFPVMPTRGLVGSQSYKDAKQPVGWLVPRGHLDATTDVATIREWWSRTPKARIGLNVARSGLFVIDLDDYKEQAEGLPELPATLTSHTPQGGRHLFYKRPPGDWTDRRLAGVDTKGNGYVILHSPESGGYRWGHSDPIPLLIDRCVQFPAELAARLLRPEDKGPGPQNVDELERWERYLVDQITERRLGEYRVKGLDQRHRVVVELEHCPFDAGDHAAPWKAIVGVGSNGFPFALCVKEGCAGRGWADLPANPVWEEVRGHRPPDDPWEEWIWNGADLARADIPPVTTLPCLGVSGLIAEGFTNLLAAFPKVGKTTLVVALLREWLDDGHRILYFTEEPLQIWKSRLGGDASSWANLVLVFALGRNPAECLSRVDLGVEDIVVVDTLRTLLGWEDENNSRAVQMAMAPWIRACRKDHKTLLGLHHARKDGGEFGHAIAGSAHILGLVDVAISLSRTKDEDKTGRRIETTGRFGFPELTYRMVGGKLTADAWVSSRQDEEIQLVLDHIAAMRARHGSKPTQRAVANELGVTTEVVRSAFQRLNGN